MDVVRMLVEKNGGDVNKSEFKACSPIRVAARNGQTDIVWYLIEKGTEVDSEADDRDTPLGEAARGGDSLLTYT